MSPRSPLLSRPARREELPRIADVIKAAFIQYRDVAPKPIFQAYLDDLRNLGDHWNESELLVAEQDGQIAGSVTFFPDASAEGLGLPAEWVGFRRLAVLPAARGQGIGNHLVETCIAAARKTGRQALGIHTADFMQAACHIYEKAGFRRVPQYDLRASDMLGSQQQSDDVAVIAYRLELSGT